MLRSSVNIKIYLQVLKLGIWVMLGSIDNKNTFAKLKIGAMLRSIDNIKIHLQIL